MRIKAKGNYWTDEQDKAIKDYLNEVNVERRNTIFNKYLFEQLYAMASTIIKKYYHRSSEELIMDGVTHVVNKAMHKYDPSKAKSYSFFQTVIKNYYYTEFITKGIKESKHESLSINTVFDSIESKYSLQYHCDPDHDDDMIERKTLAIKHLKELKNKRLSEKCNIIIDTLISVIKEGEYCSDEYITLLLLTKAKLKTANLLRYHANQIEIKIRCISTRTINKVLSHYANQHGIQFSGQHDLLTILDWQRVALNNEFTAQESIATDEYL